MAVRGIGIYLACHTLEAGPLLLSNWRSTGKVEVSVVEEATFTTHESSPALFVYLESRQAIFTLELTKPHVHMAPRGRLLDLERDDVLFFSGDYHQSGHSSVATHALVFWPAFVVAALLLHLMAPFRHAAAVCAVLYVTYCFLLDRAARPSYAWPAAATHQCTKMAAAYTVEKNS
ncbi:hypothetical protein HU200_038970 [Digitaria exilis]|uniref:Uncharacterized protein n=1 Tax=Digitaria exilis TaxID=1010633 RepID=A0A835BC19_9POAL|nr:hypothetical protein HU200_038970 [Digitaria exilis]